MDSISPPLAFPTWRDLWMSIEGIPELLTAADAALQRRVAGNHRIPRWTVPDKEQQTLALGIRALQLWAQGEPPKDVMARPSLIRRIHHLVKPVLSAAAWPRWLLLERAFADASTTGDLLFAALVLRTMCEEVLRLHALDIDVEGLATLAGSADVADQERLNQFLAFASSSLATLASDTVLEGEGWPALKSTAKAMPRLEKARAALNSYVHPNYGSHIVALFPERAAAGRLLLEAVASVYEAFFALSWSEKPVTGPTRPVDVGPVESWAQTTRRLLSEILPEARRTAGDDAFAEVMNAPAITRWLTTERDDLEAMLLDPEAAPLTDGLPRRQMCDADARASGFRIWEGANAADILGFAAARRAEHHLVSEFQAGAPDATDQVQWLRFNNLCLELAMLVGQTKAAAFKVQLARQVVQGNGLAALLCVRSLIEHRALAVWLPQQIAASLDAAASQIQAGGDIPATGRGVETALANFLAAQAKHTKEVRRAWVMRGQGDTRLAWLNLEHIVKTAFPEDDRFRKLYALTSAALHARAHRGIELLLRAAALKTSSRDIGLLVLERLCDRDEEMDHLAAAGIALMRMGHSADFGGTAAATTDDMARQVFGHFREAFVAGEDYSGDGTRESPFSFGQHLEFYQASYALLAQLGIDPGGSRRGLDHDASGHLCDRWHGPDREYWFRASPDRWDI
ncbi:hypothetical protein ACFQ3P_25675 [Paraburkholderia sabiae]|uniref:Uncharacterized protein n=1 Tax=Paraburkholderia sabiae TaxID=273251 RepID=A0ABU9QLZ6_9BURK|nr:hypothetical protein [Paraburkholderia sabiae]WJZ77303.1 hypothetical protein QEN71_35110 [Paraburkholderia sabiae]CAD6548014.1 hypothetical protein LMG24235_04517 [Paraburkholderia sabiae]